MALDATPGAPSANAYVTVEGATALLTARLGNEAWLDADSTAQAQGLMWATQLIDEQMAWKGVPTTMTQALAWPQTGQTDHLGRPVPSTIVPVAIQRATAVYAVALLEETTQDVTAVDTSLIKSRKVGDTEITYHTPSTATSASAVTTVSETMPAEVQAMLRPYGMLHAPLPAVEAPLKRATFDVE